MKPLRPTEIADVRSATLQVSNARPIPLTYVLEPWGEIYVLRPGSIFTLVSQGPDGDYTELCLDDDSIESWSATGSTVRLFDADQEVGATTPHSRPRVPQYPSSIRRPTLPLAPVATYEVKVLLINGGGRALTVSASTASQLRVLAPAARCALVAEGMVEGPVEIMLGIDSVAMSGWPGSQLTLLEEEGQ
jgi:hypothetical protein